jgi:hypothetical protein
MKLSQSLTVLAVGAALLLPSVAGAVVVTDTREGRISPYYRAPLAGSPFPAAVADAKVAGAVAPTKQAPAAAKDVKSRSRIDLNAPKTSR